MYLSILILNRKIMFKMLIDNVLNILNIAFLTFYIVYNYLIFLNFFYYEIGNLKCTVNQMFFQPKEF